MRTTEEEFTLCSCIALNHPLHAPTCRWCGKPNAEHNQLGSLATKACEYDMQTTLFTPRASQCDEPPTVRGGICNTCRWWQSQESVRNQ